MGGLSFSGSFSIFLVKVHGFSSTFLILASACCSKTLTTFVFPSSWLKHLEVENPFQVTGISLTALQAVLHSKPAEAETKGRNLEAGAETHREMWLTGSYLASRSATFIKAWVNLLRDTLHSRLSHSTPMSNQEDVLQTHHRTIWWRQFYWNSLFPTVSSKMPDYVQM